MVEETNKSRVRLNDGKIHHVSKKRDGVYIDGVKIDLSKLKV